MFGNVAFRILEIEGSTTSFRQTSHDGEWPLFECDDIQDWPNRKICGNRARLANSSEVFSSKIWTAHQYQHPRAVST
jgi:hypothetical protein